MLGIAESVRDVVFEAGRVLGVGIYLGLSLRLDVIKGIILGWGD